MFFLFILVILVVLGIAVYTSRIGIEIENLVIDTEKTEGHKINKDSKIFVYLLIFKKFKLFKRDVKNQKIKFRNKDIDLNLLKNKDLKIDYQQLLQKPNIYIDKIDLNVQLSTEDAALTAILTGFIATMLGVIIRKPKYEIIPIYSNRNFLKIKLDCIISVHLMQYIYKLGTNKIENLGSISLNKKVEV